jgi:hypothetical protein
MIAMKFTIELDIGLSFLLQAALPQLVTDRETKTHRRARSDRTAIADAALKILQRQPSGCRQADRRLRLEPRVTAAPRATNVGISRRRSGIGAPHA